MKIIPCKWNSLIESLCLCVILYYSSLQLQRKNETLAGRLRESGTIGEVSFLKYRSQSLVLTRFDYTSRTCSVKKKKKKIKLKTIFFKIVSNNILIDNAFDGIKNTIELEK